MSSSPSSSNIEFESPSLTPISSNSSDNEIENKTKVKKKSKSIERSINSSIKKKKFKQSISSKQFKIFRNLLILEQNLRMQFINQKNLRNKFLIFYFLMILTSLIIFLKLYLIEDNNLFLKFFLVFQIITLCLFHISGEYKRTIIMPKKFIYLTNKSLRQLNLRLIKLPKSLIDELFDVFKFFFKCCLIILILNLEKLLKFNKLIKKKNFFYIKNILKILKIFKLRLILLNLNYYDQLTLNNSFEIKLILNSRIFNPNIRESWELFRNEFWFREFNRRTNIIYNINFDSDINSIEKMILSNESIIENNNNNNSNSNNNNNNSNNSQSLSPVRTPKNKKKTSTSSSSSSSFDNTPLTPITTKMLKSFEIPENNNTPLSIKELVNKDKNDRKIRRKSLNLD